MIEVEGNLWSYNPPEKDRFDARVITTNGSIKNNGENPMGAGSAREAFNQFPQLPKLVARHLKQNGNHVISFGRKEIQADYDLVIFPTKHQWHENSDTMLISRSAYELIELTDKEGWGSVILPRPGCGAGNLRWVDVKRILNPLLDDRFYIITFL